MPDRNRKLLPVKLISPALFLLLFFSNSNGFAQKMKAEKGRCRSQRDNDRRARASPAPTDLIL
jgi:hypothetical protein